MIRSLVFPQRKKHNKEGTVRGKFFEDVKGNPTGFEKMDPQCIAIYFHALCPQRESPHNKSTLVFLRY